MSLLERRQDLIFSHGMSMSSGVVARKKLRPFVQSAFSGVMRVMPSITITPKTGASLILEDDGKLALAFTAY
jgi:hypothetical protein